MSNDSCLPFSSLSSLSLIGMPGSGKSTVGVELAKRLDMAHVDTDFLIESVYGIPLQAISEALDREHFLEVEAAVIAEMRVKRAVISTGGSVVYCPETMTFLASLGPIVYLDVPLPTLLKRIAENPDRGITFAPGQTLETLYQERLPLYEKWATHTISVADHTLDQTVQAVLSALDLSPANL